MAERVQRFGEDGILALKHRMLTQGPIDNALMLFEALPEGASLHVLSRACGLSRGRHHARLKQARPRIFVVRPRERPIDR